MINTLETVRFQKWSSFLYFFTFTAFNLTSENVYLCFVLKQFQVEEHLFAVVAVVVVAVVVVVVVVAATKQSKVSKSGLGLSTSKLHISAKVSSFATLINFEKTSSLSSRVLTHNSRGVFSDFYPCLLKIYQTCQGM